MDKDSVIESMLKILKEEFGIANEAELDKAIRSQTVIDLAPFCKTINNYKETVK